MTFETYMYFFENFTEEAAEKIFRENLDKACDYNICQSKRNEFFERALLAYENSKNLQEKYNYSSYGKYTQRFTLKGVERFEDGINYEAYNVKGLYFIGETHFNPITDEKYYWVKIGKATDLKSRMSNYNTHNPMLWRIDFSDEYEKENYYHLKLHEIAIAKCNHNEEWFLVDRQTYLEMCEKGFNYFN